MLLRRPFWGTLVSTPYNAILACQQALWVSWQRGRVERYVSASLQGQLSGQAGLLGPQALCGVLSAARSAVQRGYDEEWLGGTFSQAVFVGNGLMAILSGFLAHTLVEGLSLGPVAPFDAAHAVLLLGGVVVVATWTENFGDESREHNSSLASQIGAALQAIRRGELLPPTSWDAAFCLRQMLALRTSLVPLVSL